MGKLSMHTLILNAAQVLEHKDLWPIGSVTVRKQRRCLSCPDHGPGSFPTCTMIWGSDEVRTLAPGNQLYSSATWPRTDPFTMVSFLIHKIKIFVIHNAFEEIKVIVSMKVFCELNVKRLDFILFLSKQQTMLYTLSLQWLQQTGHCCSKSH